jgi:hypothetical protein
VFDGGTELSPPDGSCEAAKMPTAATMATATPATAGRGE